MQDKRWLEEPIPFHDFTARQQEATMTVETRAIPKGTTPLTKQTFQTFSCLFMSNEAIPGEAKHAEFAIELQQIGAIVG